MELLDGELRQCRQLGLISRLLIWPALLLAIVMTGKATLGTWEYLSYSQVDLTVDQLQWAKDSMNGVAVGPEPTGKTLPAFQWLCAGAAVVSTLLLWAIALASRLLLAHPATQPMTELRR